MVTILILMAMTLVILRRNEKIYDVTMDILSITLKKCEKAVDEGEDYKKYFEYMDKFVSYHLMMFEVWKPTNKYLEEYITEIEKI